MTFRWELSDLTDVGTNGFKIENLSSQEVYNNGVEVDNSETSLDVQVTTKFKLNEPGIIKFKISIKTIDDILIEKVSEYQWVDRIYAGVSTIEQMGVDLIKNLPNYLLNSAGIKEIPLEFPQVSNQYFIFALLYFTWGYYIS